MKPIAEQVLKMEGILSVSIHIGNADVLGEFVYQDREQLVEILLSKAKQLEGVGRVIWSEEVVNMPIEKENIMASYNRLMSS
jgi:hypothetical protein